MANPLSEKFDMASLPAAPEARAPQPSLQLTATRAHLRQMFWARNTILLAVCLWLAAHGEMPSRWVAGILAIALLVNAVTWIRLRRAAPVTHVEFLVQIFADVALISAGLHHSGGDSSTFGVLSFLPLTVAAATLPWRQTLIVFVAIFGVHELVCHYLPGAVWPDPDERRMDLLVGGLIGYFVFCMARGSRLHEEQLARMREQYLDQRHAAELGTVAASAVHQLSTPLATLAVVVGELRAIEGERGEHRGALEVMARQIETCKQISSRMLAFTGHARAEGGGKMAADRFVARIVEKCRLMQPWMSIEHRANGVAPAPKMVADSSLEQAILVLLHSSPGVLRQVEIAHEWDREHLRISLCDYGPVSHVQAADEAGGTPLFAARVPPDSKQFDLLMAKAAIERLGGTIHARLLGEASLCMEITVPLSCTTANRAHATC